MKQQEEKYLLNISGEFAVCTELLKRGIFASVTHGNKKATDVIAIGKGKKAYVIEVKTSSSNRVVTSFFQKYYDEKKEHPDFWVLVQMDSNTLQMEFYVLTHQEMGDAQMIRNNMTEWHKVIGVDNVILSQLDSYKNNWNTILKEVE